MKYSFKFWKFNHVGFLTRKPQGRLNLKNKNDCQVSCGLGSDSWKFNENSLGKGRLNKADRKKWEINGAKQTQQELIKAAAHE